MKRHPLLAPLSSLLLSAALASPALADKPFNLKVDVSDAKVGQVAQAQIHLTPGAGMHVNTEYPTVMTVSFPTGVTGAATKIKPAKIEKGEARFDVAYTAAGSGAKVITGTVSFVVCNDAMTQCDPRREPVQIPINVR